MYVIRLCSVKAFNSYFVLQHEIIMPAEEYSALKEVRIFFKAKQTLCGARPHCLSPPRGPFLETTDNFPGTVSIFSSSFIYQLMVNLAICFMKLQKLKFSFQN